MKKCLLTICIATYNRADHLNNTLINVIGQINIFDDVEVLVVDGNSTDHTELVVRNLQSQCRHLRYIKLLEKGGVDKDYDIAVQQSAGLYCWLFTDDDLLKDEAVSKVRSLVLSGYELIIVNSEICDYDFKVALKRSVLQIFDDLEVDLYPQGRDYFFKLCATYISFIGAIVIKKELWIELPRSNFYGTRFIHVGVISTLSNSTKVIVLAVPLIKIRLGNAEWNNISFKVWTQLWPNLIWSFSNLSYDCKRAICLFEPWRSIPFLLWTRALGTFSKKEYLEYISNKPISFYRIIALIVVIFPRFIPYFIFLTYATIRRDALMLYYLGDGNKSKNTWLSAE
jgi:abequosyltransferase